ncbi:MAG: glutamate--cysteine ligase [Wenzhouxiangella sp.]|nr:MAG: glutamate--cysteine ligase [Wenzhouxiangella sp.]
MPILDPVTPQPRLHAFSGYGIELEYMIVDRETLAVKPIADELLRGDDHEIANEVAHGKLAWSNELVLHVLELKTNGPAERLDALSQLFHRDLVDINLKLAEHDAQLLPTAMHPLFEPASDTRLWPHGQNEIYQAYDRIFGCHGHGWSNLQSMHINLPFFDDAEFRRLHAAIRIVLPLIPALAAASPLEQGRPANWLDNRLRYYRDNQKAIPQISGLVVPEAVAGIEDYHQRILAPMYRAIEPHDPDGILADDWLNSRGAIARFERQTIEIRVIDLQECPAADLAIAEAVVALVKALYEEEFADFDAQQATRTEQLAELFWQSAGRGSSARIEVPALLALYRQPGPQTVMGIWRGLLDRGLRISAEAASVLEQILQRGSLAEAIMKRVGAGPERAAIVSCYRELGSCLAENQLFPG